MGHSAPAVPVHVQFCTSLQPHLSTAAGSEAEEEEETRTKRARTAYTRQQLQMMELSFRTCPYPDSHSRKEIAKRLGITEGKVQVSAKAGYACVRFVDVHVHILMHCPENTT